MKNNLTDYQRAVLFAVHSAPYIEPGRQTQPVQCALDFLKAHGLLTDASYMKPGALESSEKGAKLLGYA